ncbi:nucleoside diphosphate kinase 3 isoform X1 [Rattus rattus]|uniref:nucleoside diphosphate kinase 3 isoform X1 n=1 Tax=Rattus rattus TaxID=10117 RepID=UPI0013F30460|nr:nucleoside diphosphate kinase 3 isoform X1 [Rattus rattus]
MGQMTDCDFSGGPSPIPPSGNKLPKWPVLFHYVCTVGKGRKGGSVEQSAWCYGTRRQALGGTLRQVLGAAAAFWAQMCWDCRAPGEPAPRGPLRVAPPPCRLVRLIRRHDLPGADHLCQPLPLSGVNERTFLAVKPDGVQRRLVGEIVRRFERKGFKLVALKLVQASEELLREHYVELRERPFYSRLVKYMSSGPVVAMVWQGLDVVRASRALIGATDPGDAMPGTIRGDFCVEVGKNVIHGSDSVESAQREIALWFREDELLCWEDSAGHWLYE